MLPPCLLRLLAFALLADEGDIGIPWLVCLAAVEFVPAAVPLGLGLECTADLLMCVPWCVCV